MDAGGTNGKKCIHDEVMVSVTMFVNVDDGKSDLIFSSFNIHWHFQSDFPCHVMIFF